MNYSSYQAPADPAAITLPSDGSATPYQLNPTHGVQTATATPADAPVVIDGIQLSASQAKEWGFTDAPEAPTPDVPSEPPVDAPEASSEAQEDTSELPEGVAGSFLDEGTAGVLDSLLDARGDLAMSAINSVLNDGQLTGENLSDIATASNLTIDQASEAFEQVSAHLDNVLDGQSSLLSLAAETDSAATKASIVSALHGSPEEAMRIIAATASSMDTSSSSEALVDALNENGYETSYQNGRLYLKGNEYSIPQPWSRVYSAFDLSLI